MLRNKMVQTQTSENRKEWQSQGSFFFFFFFESGLFKAQLVSKLQGPAVPTGHLNL